MLDRRTLLVSASSAAVLAAALPKAAFANAIPPEDYQPRARIEPVTEELWGVKITDNYRWMEMKDEDPEWQPYMVQQAKAARAKLDKVPGLEGLKSRVAELSGDLEIVSSIQVTPSHVFIEKRPRGSNSFQLFVRHGMDGEDMLVFNPESRTEGEVSYAMNYWLASPDGLFVMLGVSAAGSEDATIEIHDVEKGEILPERINRAQYASPSWLPDSSGFFFNRLAEGPKLGDLDYYKNSVCWLHKLNTDPSADVRVLSKGQFADVEVGEIDFPSVFAVTDSGHVVGGLFAGVQNEITLYTNTLEAAAKGEGGWKKVCGPEDKVTGWTQRGGDLWLLTYKDAPRYRVLGVKAESPAVAGAIEAVPQSDAVIQSLHATKDAVYLRDLTDGIGTLRRIGADGKIAPVALPFAGSIGNVFADPGQDGFIFGLQSWVRPNAIFRIGADGTVTETNMGEKPSFDVSAYDAVEVLAPAKDGVSVPLSIVFRKDRARDGSAPALMQAYGSYGINQDPVFLPRMIAWLEKGGVWATAHVRGGGERGREWHEAGKGLKKPNTWGDLIACAEYLIAEKWTSAAKLAINGGSAGGITMGRAMTDRPDLFAAVIANVGVHNTLRAEFSQNGPPNIPEFGTVTEEDGFKGLLAMDSTQHVRADVRYPATLLTTGMTDPRVEPWQVSKFYAHLMETATEKPVLMRIDFNAGHGLGSTRAQRDSEVADMFAFILWNTGEAGFQPG
jgi:prolyl oligopeptidase